MTLRQELGSWFSASGPAPSEAPKLGSKAPDGPKITPGRGRPLVVAFLRHCGCPFAEKTFLNLRETANAHRDMDFYAFSHSNEASTKKWLQSLPQPGSEPKNLQVIVDDSLQSYAAWGLGASSFGHTLSPSALYEVWRLGKEEGIWNRPTESGSRWQTSGFWAVDGDGIVRWGREATSASDVPQFKDAVSSLHQSTS